MTAQLPATNPVDDEIGIDLSHRALRHVAGHSEDTHELVDLGAMLGLLVTDDDGHTEITSPFEPDPRILGGIVD